MVKMYSNGITRLVNEKDVSMMLRAGYVKVEDPKPVETPVEPETSAPAKPESKAKK